MGTVYLVGAGPGDPGLLTMRGARLLRRAEVIVYDALVNPRLLDLAPAGATRIDVGKRGGGRRTPQAMIDTILVDAARRARTVVRLKGGDPFVFGRGAEEAMALRAAGVRYRIVPGVSAGIAAPAYAGIPVTHRGVASSVTFVTGHSADGGNATDWPALARTGGTIVLFMPVAGLRATVDALLAAGLAASTPAAAIEWGTYRHQRVLTAPLGELAARAEAERLDTPSTVVIGTVAAYAEELAWYPLRERSASNCSTTLHNVDREGPHGAA